MFVCCCIGVAPVSAQLILIKGAPVEAIKTRIVSIEGNSFTTSGTVARSSNGSTYEEFPDRKTGEIDLIHIDDIPGQRSIALDVKRKLYYIQPMPFSKIGNIASKEDLQKNIESLNTLKPAHTSENGVETEETYLGFRTQDGFLEFGRHTVYEHLPSSWALSQKVWEDWSIPSLMITVEKTGFDDNNQPVNITRLSNIQTKEPDPHLFEIPPGYSPAPIRPSK